MTARKEKAAKPLPILLDRLGHAIRARLGVEAKRSDLLKIAAAAFGHRNENELAACAKAGALDAAPAAWLREDGGLTILLNTLAGAEFGVETAFLGKEGRDRHVVSPYGALLELPAIDGSSKPATPWTPATPWRKIVAEADDSAMGRGECVEHWLDRRHPSWRRRVALRGGGTARLRIEDQELLARVEGLDTSSTWRGEHQWIAAKMAGGHHEVPIDPDPTRIAISPTWLAWSCLANADAGDDALARSLSHALGRRVVAAFAPQAWINDNAVTVDAEGPVGYDATETFVEALAMDAGDFDGLADDPLAPKWIRDWSGPFEITPSIDPDDWIDLVSRDPGV